MGIPLPDLDLTDVSPEAGMKKGCDLITDAALKCLSLLSQRQSTNEGLSLESGQTRLGAGSRILVNQLLGSSLIQCLYNKAEFLVSCFLGWLLSQKSTELLDTSSQGTALMAISLTANKRLTK
jgi:hypothetical protein